MTASLDTGTEGIYRSDVYVGWFYPVPNISGLFEVHFVPKDPSGLVVVVANCTLTVGKSLGHILDSLFETYPKLMTVPKTRPSKINYLTLKGNLWTLTLCPMADTRREDQYPEYDVAQLVWSDDHHRFPWDDKWEYDPRIQKLLFDENRQLH